MELQSHLGPNKLTVADSDDADYTLAHPPKSAPSGPLSSERPASKCHAKAIVMAHSSRRISV